MSLTAAFLAELAKPNFKGNIVIKIDNTYFSQYQVDSGLVVPTDYLGLVNTLRLNGSSLDIRKSRTPITNASFNLLDKDGLISAFMGATDNSLQGSTCEILFGFITNAGFDFADYARLAKNKITGVSLGTNELRFNTNEIVDLIQTQLLFVKDNLDGTITDVAVTLDLVDASLMPVSGFVKIEDEFIQYSGKTLNQLTGLTRGVLGSTTVSHADGVEVSRVTKKDNNSMDMILDILENDLGIALTDIDVTSFTDLRDNDFSGEQNQVLYIYDVENALRWIEERLLDSTNTRIFSVNGVITIGLLDQAPRVDDTVEEINEDHIQQRPQWNISDNKLVNQVRVSWGWVEGTQKFINSKLFTNADSIATYGARKELTLKLYGFTDSAIATNRSSRLLTRLSTPTPSIKVRTHLEKYNINLADSVRLTHRYLPQQGGGLGFSDILEVISKGVSGLHNGASVDFSLEFTSYTGIRLGLISPSPKLNLTITDQKTFEIPDGSYYEVGYRLRLRDNVNNLYFADAINEVQSISGNFITMKDAWVTVLGANTSLYFSGYDQASGNQRAKYAYVAPNTGVFLIDNSKAYQIIF